MHNLETTDIKHIAYLVHVLVENNINHVVVSPGSRNAPLTIAFDSHPDIKIYLIHDEKAASFFALGLSEALQKPVAITCTSGSASLNYSPGIVEAYYRQIPLLILTADRPNSLIDQGDGQCIRQEKIYEHYIKSFYRLPELPKTDDELKQSNLIVEQAIFDLKTEAKGPVHINIPLHEPLYQVGEFKPSLNHTELEINQRKNILSKADEVKLLNIWNLSLKKLIVVGQLTPSVQLNTVLNDIANDSSVAILVENTSNLNSFKKFCHSIDRTLALITEDEIENFKPDLLLSLGGAIVSKKVKTFFRSNKPKHNWRLGEYLIDEDTFQSKTENIITKPIHFLSHLAKQAPLNISNFGSLWKGKDFKSMAKHDEFINVTFFSDLKVIGFVLDTLPDDSILEMSNSSVVRYCQLFNPIPSVQYFSNRGVSGIEGSTSTAVGMAVGNPNKLVTLITGDISFFYDSNGLWNENLPTNLRIFLINNNGGGIFNILEGSQKSNQNKLFVAPHQAKAKGICLAYNVHYNYANSLESVENKLAEFYTYAKDNRPKLMEIDTSTVNNHKVLGNYFKALKG